MKILVIFTCFNRKAETENCIRRISSGNPGFSFTYVVVDDHSIDGTAELLEVMRQDHDMHILHGNGGLFYSGGMHLGMQYALDCLENDYEYLLMVNDDVSFFDGFVQKIADLSKETDNAVIAGATCDSEGKLSYSAIKYTKGLRIRQLDISEWKIPADTFNANCVLIPYTDFQKAGAIDSHYRHSLGDFDYGLQLKRNGASLHVSREYVGICEKTSSHNTWTDTSLGRWERLKKKESAKGAPVRQWFYFLKKNFGFKTALLKTCTPYLRILLGR